MYRGAHGDVRSAKKIKSKNKKVFPKVCSTSCRQIAAIISFLQPTLSMDFFIPLAGWGRRRGRGDGSCHCRCRCRCGGAHRGRVRGRRCADRMKPKTRIQVVVGRVRFEHVVIGGSTGEGLGRFAHPFLCQDILMSLTHKDGGRR